MAAPRKYPEELGERAIRLVLEVKRTLARRLARAGASVSNSIKVEPLQG